MAVLEQFLTDGSDPLTPAEIDALVRQAPDSFSGRRNVEIMQFMLRTGARVGATVHVKQEHLDFETRELRIAKAKLDSERTLKLDRQHLDRIQNYLNLEGFPDSEWLFSGMDGGVISTRYVRKFVNDYAREAGLSTERVHPHLFRHTFASRLLETSQNLRTVQQALGHDDVRTTFRYLHPLDESTQEIIEEGEDFDLARFSSILPFISESEIVA